MLVYTRKICYRAVCILVYMLVHALVHTCLHSTLHSMCQHSLHAAFAIAVLPHFCTRKCLQLNLQTCWHDLWHTRSWILAYILWTESVCKLLYNTIAATLIKTIAFANKIWLHARCQIQFTCSGKKRFPNMVFQKCIHRFFQTMLQILLSSWAYTWVCRLVCRLSPKQLTD